MRYYKQAVLISLYKFRLQYKFTGKSKPNSKKVQKLTQATKFKLSWKIHKPTQITRTSKPAINNVITYLDLNLEIDIVNTAISDHHGQTVTIINQNPQQIITEIKLIWKHLKKTYCRPI